MSKHLWILSVLADLDEYSRRNSLVELSEIIQNARRTAIEVISNSVEEEFKSKTNNNSFDIKMPSQSLECLPANRD